MPIYINGKLQIQSSFDEVILTDPDSGTATGKIVATANGLDIYVWKASTQEWVAQTEWTEV